MTKRRINKEKPSNGGAGSGTWRCMGYGYQNGKHTKATVLKLRR